IYIIAVINCYCSSKSRLRFSNSIQRYKDSFDMNFFQKYPFTWLAIFVSFLVFIESFTPVERVRQSIALVGNKLYFFGGQTAFLSSTKDVFYLDVSPLQLNTLNPSWTDVSKTAPITVNSSYVSACVGGSVNNSVFLLEYHSKDNAVSSVMNVYVFDAGSQRWTSSIITGTAPASTQNFQVAISNNGKIYIFGGQSVAVGTVNTTFLNSMIILDSVNLLWLPSVSSGTSKPRETIDPRDSHTAVLAPNGYVIIYGGSRNSTIAGVFASDSDVVFNANRLNPKIYILDTTNYTWVTSIDVNKTNQNKTVTATPTGTPTPNPNIGMIIGLVILAIVIVIAIGVGFFLYRRRTKKYIIAMPGTNREI
ncbi:8551_t:CDS:2, partial [Racocetra persica]